MKRFLETDWILVCSALFIFGTGLLSLYSLSTGSEASAEPYFTRQVLFGIFGIAVMFGISLLDYRHIGRFSVPLYFVTIALLVFVLFFGKTVRGTSGWISLGFFQLQPVELAKVALLLLLARFIAQKRTELGEWVRIVASLVLSSAMVFLVLRQPDLGSALSLLALWVGMTIVSGIRLRHVVALVLIGTALAFTGWVTLADYQRDRIEAFLDPEADPQGSGYNVLQSMVAIGSGGMFGKGIGYGSQSQLNFLPEKHTDFLFAVVTEELGMIGAGLLLFSYGVLLFRIYRIAIRAGDNTGFLLGVGMMTYFLFQILVNIGMNLGVFPVTGLPAPLLSYGGSSLLVTFAMLGLLLSVYRRRTEGIPVSRESESADLFR